MEHLERQWRMLKIIPPHGKGMTRLAIQSLLFGDDERSIKDPALTRKIQRDLSQLGSLLPELEVRQNVNIEGNKIGHPTYSWGKGGPPTFFGGMSVNETLAFGVLKQIGVEWMPQAMQKALEPFFKEALDEAAQLVGGYQGLSKLQSIRQTNRWLKKVHHIPVGISFKCQPIKESVELAVHEALLNETCLQIEYRNTSGQESTVVISPQALVRRGDRTYLYAKRRDHVEVWPYLMYRILSAKTVIGDFELAKDFNLQERLKEGIANHEFEDKEYGRLVKLKLLVKSKTANWLKETPLSDDQTISTAGRSGEGFLLEATVPMQEELVWWLRSMGGNIQVLAPDLIVKRIKDDLKKALNSYK